jgi:FMN phosphatase YigB (HAD superfamily)
MFKEEKVILTDADGVLFNWEYAFNVWMEQHGFESVPGGALNYNIGDRYNISNNQGHKLIKMFNESAAIGFLPALRDAVYYVKRLHEEHGYEFHCITSLSLDPNAYKLRKMNLDKLFGDTAFTRLVCLDTGAHKDEALAEYKDTGLYWIEDKPENAEAGLNAGLKSIVIEHGHNMHYHSEHIPVVKNWKEIYQLLTNES